MTNFVSAEKQEILLLYPNAQCSKIKRQGAKTCFIIWTNQKFISRKLLHISRKNEKEAWAQALKKIHQKMVKIFE